MKTGFDDLSRAYASSEIPKRTGEVARFVDWIQPQGSERALDVASGPATIARELAARTNQTFALDRSHCMLSEARRVNRLPSNLFLTAGVVERLPFRDGTFDILTCAYALANLSDLAAILREFGRVVARSSRIAIMDVIAPEDPSQCRYLNLLESMRSDFYTRIRTHGELLALFGGAGLTLESSEVHLVSQLISNWLRLSPAAAGMEEASKLRKAFLEFGDGAGLRLQEVSENEIEFSYQTEWFLLRKA